jgi:2-C-methyl-D-erythritol 4-phosphate cytidylyltransferase
MPEVWTIVVAGGSGERFGERKQFALLGGRPVASWAIEAGRPWSAGVVLVIPVGAETDDLGADVVVEGGATRSESVRQGLAKVPATAQVIIVHDAARPLASAELFGAVLDAVGRDGADAAIPGVPVPDTIKRVDASRVVTDTLDRSELVAVQTPQAFRGDVLRQAHERETVATDDAALVEALGAKVRVVPGEIRNLKITTPDDLRTAARLIGEGSK